MPALPVPPPPAVGPRPVSPWSYGPTPQPAPPAGPERPVPAPMSAEAPPGPTPPGPMPPTPAQPGPMPPGPAQPGPALHKATGAHQAPLRDAPPPADPAGRSGAAPAHPAASDRGSPHGADSTPPGAPTDPGPATPSAEAGGQVGPPTGHGTQPDAGAPAGLSGPPPTVPQTGPGTPYPAPGTTYPAQGTPYPAQGTGYPAPGTPYPAPPAGPGTPYGQPGAPYAPGAYGGPPGQPGVAPPGTGVGGPPPPGHPGAPGAPYGGQPGPGAPAGPPGRPPTVIPTAEEFARRRAVRPPDPVATMGVRAAVNRSMFGLVKMRPGRYEQEIKHDVEMVRRNFGGLRQVTVVNPKGGAGKTVAILLLAMTFGQKRGGYVLAWDNNETQGTLGMRAQQDFHSRTVRDLLRDLEQFRGTQGRVGDLSQYVRAQGEGMFDVLASDESATAGEMLTRMAFGDIREVVSRFYKLIFVDTGNNVRAENWQAAIDATDQLVVTMSARNDSAEPAARMLDHLEQTGRQRLVRQAITVVSMPPSRKEIDLPAIEQHFAARTRAVLLAPYERLIDSGEPVRYGQLSTATRDAWLKIAAAVAVGL
ncbi:chromosome partitioning protein [Polymorphospora rubra]|uniref:MinD/ParA family ATP-binding protein n=1 Tax=Polymorphospora rubra TaxID=338584 RepID=UPI0034095D29